MFYIRPNQKVVTLAWMLSHDGESEKQWTLFLHLCMKAGIKMASILSDRDKGLDAALRTHDIAGRKCSLHWLRNRCAASITEPNLITTTEEIACYDWQWTCKATNEQDLLTRLELFIASYVKEEHHQVFRDKFETDKDSITLVGHLKLGIDPLNDTASNGVEGANNGLSARTVHDGIRGKMPDAILRAFILKARADGSAYRRACIQHVKGTRSEVFGLTHGLTDAAVRLVVESVKRGLRQWEIMPWAPLYEGLDEEGLETDVYGWTTTACRISDNSCRALTVLKNGETTCPCGKRAGKGLLCSELNRFVVLLHEQRLVASPFNGMWSHPHHRNVAWNNVSRVLHGGVTLPPDSQLVPAALYPGALPKKMGRPKLGKRSQKRKNMAEAIASAEKDAGARLTSKKYRGPKICSQCGKADGHDCRNCPSRDIGRAIMHLPKKTRQKHAAIADKAPSAVCADVVDLSNDGDVILPVHTSAGAILSTSTFPTVPTARIATTVNATTDTDASSSFNSTPAKTSSLAVDAYGGTYESKHWNFTCVREEVNKVKEAKKQMGELAYFNQGMERMADKYGELAEKGKAYLAGISDDDSSINSKDSYSRYLEPHEEVDDPDDGVWTLKDLNALRSYSTRLTARGLFKMADEADGCIESGEKATFMQTLVWDSELKVLASEK